VASVRTRPPEGLPAIEAGPEKRRNGAGAGDDVYPDADIDTPGPVCLSPTMASTTRPRRRSGTSPLRSCARWAIPSASWTRTSTRSPAEFTAEIRRVDTRIDGVHTRVCA